MSGSTGDRITTLEVEFKNITAGIADLRVLVKEKTLDIQEDFRKERENVDARFKENERKFNKQDEKLLEQDKKIEEHEKFRQKLLAQISVIMAVGAIGMTFVYEFIKQAIHSLFK